MHHDDSTFERIGDSENIGSNPSTETPIGELIARRLSRRDALRGLGATAAAGALAGIGLRTGGAEAAGPSSLTFTELTRSLDARDHVAPGYDIQYLIRWGDKMWPNSPPFTPASLTAAAQARQFGYNCDFLAYMPLPKGASESAHGLLWSNHEYTNTNLIFAGVGEGRAARAKTTKEQCEVEIEAHGGAIVEIRKTDGRWQVALDSRHNRRITGNTPMTVAGPAAGHARLKTVADPTGTKVLGMLNNCAGGVTPWGTVLSGEENFNNYFGGDMDKNPDGALHKRYGMSPDATYAWPRHFDRFNIDKEPNETHRFGWVVEIDPYNPQSTPIKHTGLGRFKHEGATPVVNKDGRVVVYMGDDERFDYVYKYVSRDRFEAARGLENSRLLDDGTLYVAQFKDDGKMTWMPLIHGQGPLTAENGFRDQAEVLIYARKAADLLKATPMDRPEDVETNPVTGTVFVVLTNNNRRTPDRVDKVNPRARNDHGHIIEIVPPGGAGKDADHAAAEASWRIFLMGGRPGMDSGAMYHRAISENGWLTSPDNVAFDSKGRVLIATDGAPEAAHTADGIWIADATGPGRALTRMFYQAPTGAEVCGPCLTPDDRTLFLAIQHPGEDPGSTFEKPSTRWPDFKDDTPPRPSVVAIVKRDGGAIGS